MCEYYCVDGKCQLATLLRGQARYLKKGAGKSDENWSENFEALLADLEQRLPASGCTDPHIQNQILFAWQLLAEYNKNKAQI